MGSNILIVGTGALATLFASRLAATGTVVTMLGTWPEGLSALRTSGVCLEGDVHYPVWAVDNLSECKGIKLAFVLVKSWQTERVSHKLANCLEDDGLALTLQNGLGNDDIMSEILGKKRVMRGVTTVGATLIAPGIVRVNGWGIITLEKHPQIARILDILRVANFRVVVVEDMGPFVWGKLAINAAINPLTALLRVKNGDLLSNPFAMDLMRQLALEVALVAEANRVELPFPNLEEAILEVAQDTFENTSSMLQDILRGAPTEIDSINGAVVRMAEQSKILTPVNRIIWQLVKALSNPAKL